MLLEGLVMLGICENGTPHWGTKRVALKAGLNLVKCSQKFIDVLSILC
jgi:hypothetical protein